MIALDKNGSETKSGSGAKNGVRYKSEGLPPLHSSSSSGMSWLLAWQKCLPQVVPNMESLICLSYTSSFDTRITTNTWHISFSYGHIWKPTLFGSIWTHLLRRASKFLQSFERIEASWGSTLSSNFNQSYNFFCLLVKYSSFLSRLRCVEETSLLGHVTNIKLSFKGNLAVFL